MEEAGLAVGTLHLAACVDSIHRDEGGRVRYHYTIVDFCAAWTGGVVVAGDDVTEIAWARFRCVRCLGPVERGPARGGHCTAVADGVGARCHIVRSPTVRSMTTTPTAGPR